MTVLDAGVVVAGLLGESGRARAEELLRDRSDPPVMNGVNAGEVVARLGRSGEGALSDVLRKMVWLKHGGLELVNFDAFDGHAAGALRAKYFDRKSRQVSFGDCAALATCIRFGHGLATTDRTLALLARHLGIEVVPVANSSGELPLER